MGESAKTSHFNNRKQVKPGKANAGFPCQEFTRETVRIPPYLGSLDFSGKDAKVIRHPNRAEALLKIVGQNSAAGAVTESVAYI